MTNRENQFLERVNLLLSAAELLAKDDVSEVLAKGDVSKESEVDSQESGDESSTDVLDLLIPAGDALVEEEEQSTVSGSGPQPPNGIDPEDVEMKNHTVSTGSSQSVGSDNLEEIDLQGMTPELKQRLDALRQKLTTFKKRKLLQSMCESVTYEEVKPLMKMNVMDISSYLNICYVTWKKFFHFVGIKRWPTVRRTKRVKEDSVSSGVSHFGINKPMHHRKRK